MLDPAQRQRYARQLLLAEIGEAGQVRLSATRVRSAEGADPRALAVAEEYLARAGVAAAVTVAPAVTSDALNKASFSIAASIADVGAVRKLAGRPELEHAAAAFAGAFAAVEAIKASLGVGIPASLPKNLVFDQEPSA